MIDTRSLSINKGLPTPAYLQLKDKLSQAIARGELPAGTALPSERELADSLGLSRMTVRRAFEELVDDALVEQRQGSGTYVLPKRVEQMIDRVLGFTDEARNLGFVAGSLMLGMSTVPSSCEVAEALNIQAGETVLRIARLRTADGVPLALQIAYLAPEYTGLTSDLLKEKESLYKTLEAQYGIRPQGAKQTVSARLPNKEESEALRISRDTPVLALERITFAATGKAFEYVKSAYRGDMYRMVLDLRAP